MLGEGKTHSVNWLSVLISVSLLSLSEASIIVVSSNHDPEVNGTLKIRDVAPSDFGPDIPDDGIFGYLVHSKPTNACAPIEPPPDVNISSEFVWIALIARSKPLSSCSFAQKVINAQTAGFSTVIVYNRPGNEDVITMHADPREAALVNIPSVFIGNTDGLELKRNFIWSVSGDRYYLEVTPGYSPFDLSFYLLPFAIVVGICFVLMVIFMLAKWIRDYRKRRKSRLSKSNLKKLPVKKFKKGDNYDMCAICLDEYDEGDKLRILPCSHAYHMKCVDPWLTNNKRTCPVCKRRVLPNDPERSSESEDSDDDGPSETSPLLPPPAGNRSPRRSTFENSGLPITSRSEQQIVSSSGSTEGPDSPQRMQHHNSAYDTDSSDEEPQSVHARDQSATKPAQDITTPQAHGDSFEFHPNYFELKTDNDMAPLLPAGGAGGAQENTLCVSGEVHSNDGLISIEAPDVGATVEVHTSSGVPNEAEKV